MTATTAPDTVRQGDTPAAMRWTGWALSGLFALFMLIDIGIKLAGVPQVAQTLAPLGWTLDRAEPIAPIELLALLLYLFPRTAVLGAILLTGVMGGAVATHMRVGDPLFSHVLFGVYLGLFAWGGLWLRDARLRALTPWRA
ncbi:DoxX family protein [Caulobacter sp. KR2-114]|uniref:DoxX family protein n=1 Tax=Caulobacter sp. KR2-114 TaxID=3400912 RepID=UPI003C0D1FF0